MTDRALPNWPRLLAAAEAAAYVGLGETSFLAGVKRGDWPPPFSLHRRKLWDRLMLDERVDQLGGRLAPEDSREWMETLNEA